MQTMRELKYSPSLWLATTKIMPWKELEYKFEEYVDNDMDFSVSAQSYIVEEPGNEFDGKYVIEVLTMNESHGGYEPYAFEFLDEKPDLDEWINKARTNS